MILEEKVKSPVQVKSPELHKAKSPTPAKVISPSPAKTHGMQLK